MRNNTWNKFVFIAVVAMTLSACASKKKLVKPAEGGNLTVEDNTLAEKRRTIQKLLGTNINYTTFSGKAKANLDMQSSNYDVTANIRIERDKRIWISVTALFGIEAARVLITPDSVQILNKLQSEYMVKPFSYMYRFASPDLTFANLQDIFVANLSKNLLADVEKIDFEQELSLIRLKGNKNDLSFAYELNNQNRPNVFRLSQVNKEQSLEAHYAEFGMVSDQIFPMVLQLVISDGKQRIKTDFKYNRVAFNEAVDMPFSVPARYKVIQ